MKKILVILVALIGFGFAANAQCKFTTGSPQMQYKGTDVIITIPITPQFTPDKNGTYIVTVKPQGVWAQILKSQRQETTISYFGKWERATVTFECSMESNTATQCRSNDFEVTDCYKK